VSRLPGVQPDGVVYRGFPHAPRRPSGCRGLSWAGLGLFALLGCGMEAGGPDQMEDGWEAELRVGHSMGEPGAPVVVVEFSDFGCPYCFQFAVGTYPVLVNEFIEPGLVRWIYVPHFGRSFRNSDRAAEAAHCAGDQGVHYFQRLKEMIYLTGPAWMSAGDPVLYFRGLATTLVDRAAEDPSPEFDLRRFERCLARGTMQYRLVEARALAVERGVRGTPTFLVNGEILVGSRSPEQFRVILAEALESHTPPS